MRAVIPAKRVAHAGTETANTAPRPELVEGRLWNAPVAAQFDRLTAGA